MNDIKKPGYIVEPTYRMLDHIEKQTNDLYMIHCGIEHCMPGHTYKDYPNIRSEYHIHFILSGTGIYEIEGKHYEVGKGKIFLIPPNVLNFYQADSKDPWYYTYVAFDGANAKQYLEYSGFTNGVYVRDCIVSPEEYLDIIMHIIDARELTYANELKRVSYLFQMFALLMDTNRSVESSKKAVHDYPYEIYVEHAISYIKCNYQTIKINDIANYIGINRSYLTNIFKKQLKISPQEYLVNYRLGKSEEFLRNTDLPIHEIAQIIGYADSFSFSKLFKKKYQMSPKQYRNQYNTKVNLN